MLWFSSVVAVCMHLTRALCVTSGSRVAFVGMRTCGHPWCNKPAAVICFGQVHLCRSAIMGPYTAPISCYFPSSPSPDAIRTQISAAIRIQLFGVLLECVIILFERTTSVCKLSMFYFVCVCVSKSIWIWFLDRRWCDNGCSVGLYL